MSVVHLTLLGEFRLRLPDGAAAHVPARKARALLAFLALSAGRSHERDKLAALLWGGSPDAEARHSLRQGLSLLRRLVPGILVERDAVGLGLDALSVDVVAFERLAAAGDPASLDEATRLYVGDLLDGFHAHEEPFDQWVRGERDRLREVAVDTLGRLLAHHSREGATGPGIQAALRLLDVDPLQESVHRALMRLYLDQGRRAAALNQYQTLVELLRRDLGTEPEAETRDLYRSLLRVVPTRPVALETTPSTTPWPQGREEDPPLVGRSVELARLAAVADAVRAGRGRTVLLLAEAGGGKTRMLEELVADWLARGGRVLLGRCHEIQRTVPLAPWAAALEGAVAPADLDRIFGAASPARRQLDRLLPGPDAGVVDPDAATRGNRGGLFAAIVAVLTGLASERPLALALEDVQWADPWTLDVLARTARGIGSARVLMALTARDEELVDTPSLETLIRDLSHERALDRLPLGRLSRADVDQLVRGVVPGATSPAQVERVLASSWRISQGNPLLAIAAARDAAIGAASPVAGGPMPDRAHALMHERLRRISARARRMAELAAVIGREFELPVIARAAGVRPGEAAGVVDELVRRRILRSVGSHLEFTHDLLREAIDAGLPEADLARLHRSVATALARSRDRRAPAIARRLAHHYARAGLPRQAVTWLTRHAEESLRLCAPDEAVLALEHALALTNAHATSGRDRRRIEIVLQLAPALAAAGRVPEILKRLEPEEPVVDRLRDPDVAARYYLRVALTKVMLEESHRRAEVTRRGLASAAATGDLGALGRLQYAVAAGAFVDGLPRLGAESARRSAELLERTGDHRWRALALWMLGVHLLVLGDLDAAQAAEVRSVEAATNAGDVGVASFAAVSLAWVHLERGDPDAAGAQCRQVLGEPAEPINSTSAVGFMGLAQLECGEPARAIPLLEQVVGQLASPTRREVFGVPLGEAYVLTGDVERARAIGAAVQETAGPSTSRWRRGRAARLAGSIAGADGRYDEADRLLAQAVVDLAAVPAPLEVARVHVTSARLAIARDDRRRAEAHLDQARERYAGLPLRLERLESLRTSLAAGV